MDNYVNIRNITKDNVVMIDGEFYYIVNIDSLRLGRIYRVNLKKYLNNEIQSIICGKHFNFRCYNILYKNYTVLDIEDKHKDCSFIIKLFDDIFEEHIYTIKNDKYNIIDSFNNDDDIIVTISHIINLDEDILSIKIHKVSKQ